MDNIPRHIFISPFFPKIGTMSSSPYTLHYIFAYDIHHNKGGFLYLGKKPGSVGGSLVCVHTITFNLLSYTK